MRCSRARRQLAIYRELSQNDKQAADEHLAGCSACVRALASYIQQDAILVAMPPARVGRASSADIRTRTSVRAAPALHRRAWAAAILALLMLSMSAGIVAASDTALPGDPLYPVKRGVEEVRFRMARDHEQRLRLESLWAERRRQEAHELVVAGREAELSIEGVIDSVRNGIWVVQGLPVQVAQTLWESPPPPEGSLVRFRVAVRAGEIVAAAIEKIVETPDVDLLNRSAPFYGNDVAPPPTYTPPPHPGRGEQKPSPGTDVAPNRTLAPPRPPDQIGPTPPPLEPIQDGPADPAMPIYVRPTPKEEKPHQIPPSERIPDMRQPPPAELER